MRRFTKEPSPIIHPVSRLWYFVNNLDELNRLIAAAEAELAALERPRSGNGVHVWMFFAEPVPAALARQVW